MTIDLVDNSPFHLIGAFDGPEGTPYEGGRFQVVRLLFIAISPLCSRHDGLVTARMLVRAVWVFVYYILVVGLACHRNAANALTPGKSE